MTGGWGAALQRLQVETQIPEQLVFSCNCHAKLFNSLRMCSAISVIYCTTRFVTQLLPLRMMLCYIAPL